MFQGNYQRTIFDNNKIELPESWAIKFTNKIAMIFKKDGYLSVTTENAFKEIVKKLLEKISQTQKKQFKRFFIGDVTEVKINKNNEIILPDELLKDAKLDKEIILIGEGESFQIWSLKNYPANKIKKTKDDMDYVKNIDKLSGQTK